MCFLPLVWLWLLTAQMPLSLGDLHPLPGPSGHTPTHPGSDEPAAQSARPRPPVRQAITLSGQVLLIGEHLAYPMSSAAMAHLLQLDRSGATPRLPATAEAVTFTHPFFGVRTITGWHHP